MDLFKPVTKPIPATKGMSLLTERNFANVNAKMKATIGYNYYTPEQRSSIGMINYSTRG